MLTLAATLAVLVHRVSPAFRPLLLSLLAQLLLDQLGALGRERVQLATLVLCPTASALGVSRAFRASSLHGDAGAALTGGGLAMAALYLPAGSWWGWAWPGALAVSVAVEGAAWARWRASGQTRGITQRVAELVTALDGAALGLGLWLGWDRLGSWGQVQGFGVVAVELLFLVRFLDAGNAASHRDKVARVTDSPRRTPERTLEG